jgi:hypothetical protein
MLKYEARCLKKKDYRHKNKRVARVARQQKKDNRLRESVKIVFLNIKFLLSGYLPVPRFVLCVVRLRDYIHIYKSINPLRNN